MSIGETARETRRQPCSGPAARFAATDPELVGIFDRFAGDEVLAYGEIDLPTHQMLILASLIAQQALAAYRVMLAGALQTGVTLVAVKEIVYQAVPYVGFGKVVDFLQATNEMLEQQGIPLPLQGQATTNAGNRLDKGRALSTAIFGPVIDTLYEQAPAGQVHIQQFLSANCFGDYVARGGIDVRTRELLTFSMLLSHGGCEAQLKGHIQGNVNVGNDKSRLIGVVTRLIPFVGYPRALNAIGCLNAVLPEPAR